MTEMPADLAIKFIDQLLSNNPQIGIRKLERKGEHHSQLFEVIQGGHQFAVVVGGKVDGAFSGQRTRVVLEQLPPSSLRDVEPFPSDKPYSSGAVKNSNSRLKSPNQVSVLVGSGKGLQELIEWYIGANASTDSETEITKPDARNKNGEAKMTNSATNTILYGPPGTGKTYSTVIKAMSIVDEVEYKFDIGAIEYEKLKQRFDKLRVDGQIEFVTFHQSYGYEDFIQGIRPTTENGQVSYEIRDGSLKQISDKAYSNFQRSKKAGEGLDLDEESAFQAALNGLITAIDSGDESKSTMTTFSGAEAKLSVSQNGTRFTFNVPSTGNPWRISIAKLRSLWPRRHEIKVPADIGGFNSTYWWAALNLLKTHVDETQHHSIPVPLKQYVLIVDEINRGNISKIFGELITLVEADKRIGARYETRLTLPYSDLEDGSEPFGLPSNLHIVGTMNTADRSIALLDTALRRRFQFEELMPRTDILRNDVEGVDLQKLLSSLNKRIEALYDRDHTIGHAYFVYVESLEQLEQAFRQRILPLLQEYFYENWSKVRMVLNDVTEGNFIQKLKQSKLPADGDDSFDAEERFVYMVNINPFPIAAFKRIYGD